MFVDKDLFFNTVGTPWTFTTGTNVSPNVYDLSPLGTGTGGAPGNNTGRDLGVGSTLWWDVLCTTTATSSGANTTDFQLITDSAAALTTAPLKLASSGALAVASITAKKILVRIQLPENSGYLRFLGVKAVVAAADLTAGAFESKLTRNIQANTIYQPGFQVY